MFHDPSEHLRISQKNYDTSIGYIIPDFQFSKYFLKLIDYQTMKNISWSSLHDIWYVLHKNYPISNLERSVLFKSSWVLSKCWNKMEQDSHMDRGLWRKN